MSNKKGFALNEFYSRIYKRYDLINRIFTFGMDKGWRKAAALKSLESNPLYVLDLCCGTGDLALTISRYRQQYTQLTGFDFNKKMLEIARLKASKSKILDIAFIEGDAAAMPFPDNSFDSITIGFGFRNLIFDNPNSAKHIKEIYRVLKPHGRIIILESGIPENTVIRLFYKFYLYAFLIPVGSLISGNPKAYWYLAHSSSKFYSIAQTERILAENKLHSFACKQFFMGSANLISASK
jgi:demethylmenaquinone methyltransferase / 2-methoxy-6-polyprenyl-1,4-benzoquinol methylase